RKYFPDKKVLFILGVLKDKEYKAMVEIVAPIASGFIAITPENARALSGKELAYFISSYCKNVSFSDTIKEAISKSLKIATPNDIICAFGSLYYIGEVREYFGL